MERITLSRAVDIVAGADVVVAGGGLGGVAAALAAARAGAKVILTETNGFLGGVATAGMCCSVFNCLFSRERRQLVHGIPFEIVNRLAVDAGGPGPSWTKHKGHIIYDVERAKTVLAQMLLDAGVVIRTNSPVADVISEDGRVSALVVCGKDGLEAISCRVLVDATGDCVPAIKAGAECVSGKSAPASYLFRLGNVDTDAFADYFRQNPGEYPALMDIEWTLAEALAQYDENGTFLFPHGGGMQLRLMTEAVKQGYLPEKFGSYTALTAMQMHLIRDTGVCHVITGFVGCEDTDAAVNARRTFEGRQIAYMFCECARRFLPGFERAFVSATADDLGVRGLRYIRGLSAFTDEMKQTAYRCPDAVGTGVNEHARVMHSGKGAWAAQVFGSGMYEIPLSCLIPAGTRNVVIGSGRGADTNPPLLLRVMVNTMSVGQGAGAAAAIAAKTGADIADTDYSLIRSELVRQGVIFPED